MLNNCYIEFIMDSIQKKFNGFLKLMNEFKSLMLSPLYNIIQLAFYAR